MSLWDWATEVYDRPGVAALCLQLQDQFAQNVPYLLWAAWSGASEDALLAKAIALCQAWDLTALKPLRQVRRALKAEPPLMEASGQAALRQQIKAAELAAEQLMLQALASLASPTDGVEVDRRLILRHAAQAWNALEAATELDQLAAKLL